MLFPESLYKYVAAAVLAPICASVYSQQQVVIADDLGSTVTLEAPARRVVSLAPSITEIMFAIGAGDALVGRTRWGDYPPQASEVPSVGDGISPNVEAVVARRPDLVVFYMSNANRPAIARLEQLGIPSITVRMDRLAHVSRVARLLGRATGHVSTADSMAVEFDRNLAQLTSEQRGSECGAVILAWDNPPMVLGAGSFVSEMLTLAGGRNVFEDVESPDATVGIETIVARDPSVVLVLGDEAVERYTSRPEWRIVPAVANGRFVVAEGSQYSRPGFRAVEAIDQLGDNLAEACQ